MCDCWKKTSPDDLTLSEIEVIYRQLPKMDAVRLTGGEPFVRKDFTALADMTQRYLKPGFLHVTTNGFLTERIVSFCEQRERSVPLRLLVSMDGMEAKHNHVRGRSTAFDKTLATIHSLAARQKELNLHLSVNQTIVDADGIDQYRKLRDFLSPLNVQVNVVMAYDASATYSLDAKAAVVSSQIGQFTIFGDLDSQWLTELVDTVESDLKHFPWKDRLAKRYYWRGVRARLTQNLSKPNPSCVALNSHMRLYPNGDVPVCQFNAQCVGNVRDQSFNDVWFGTEIDKQRQWVRNCPGCWAECEVLPNAVYTGDLLLNR
jgi:MoaA/NifB/PqqE/SkfB family radical SAM enzyme